MSETREIATFRYGRQLIPTTMAEDDSCYLLTLTGDQIEILSNLLNYAHVRSSWNDETICAVRYYMPDDDAWDTLQAVVDDLEYRLMSTCEQVKLNDNAIVQIENGQQPTANTPTGMALLALGAGYAGNRIMCADGDKTLYLNVKASLPVAELSTYDWGTATPFDLVLNANGGQVGIGMTPIYSLDVTGAARVSGAFGCNGATPQARYQVATAAYDLASVIALANDLRSALGLCGITL